MGFRIPLVLFRIPKPRISLSTRQCFPDSVSGNTYREQNIIIRKFNFQLFPLPRVLKSSAGMIIFTFILSSEGYVTSLLWPAPIFSTIITMRVKQIPLLMHFICLSMQQDQNKQISRKSRLIIKRNTIPIIITDNEQLNFKESSKRNNYSGLKECNICWP